MFPVREHERVNHSFEYFCKNRQHGDRPKVSFIQNAVLLVEWSGVIWPCFQVSGTCDRVMMVLIKSLRGFAIDLDDAFTARGEMEPCPGALFGFMLLSSILTKRIDKLSNEVIQQI